MTLFCFEVKYENGSYRQFRVIHESITAAQKVLRDNGWYRPDTDDLFYEWAIKLEKGTVFARPL